MAKGIPGRGQLLRTAAAFGIASGVANVYDQQKTGFGSYNIGSIAKSAMMGAMSGASFSYGGKGRGRMSRSLMGLAGGAMAGAGMSNSQRGGAMQGAILGLGFGAGGGRLLQGTNVIGALHAGAAGIGAGARELRAMSRGLRPGSQPERLVARAEGQAAKIVHSQGLGGVPRSRLFDGASWKNLGNVIGSAASARSAQYGGVIGAELGLRAGQLSAAASPVLAGARGTIGARLSGYNLPYQASLLKLNARSRGWNI